MGNRNQTLAAANISETEVELLPDALLAKGYRLKFNAVGEHASLAARRIIPI